MAAKGPGTRTPQEEGQPGGGTATGCPVQPVVGFLQKLTHRVSVPELTEQPTIQMVCSAGSFLPGPRPSPVPRVLPSQLAKALHSLTLYFQKKKKKKKLIS